MNRNRSCNIFSDWKLEFLVSAIFINLYFGLMGWIAPLNAKVYVFVGVFVTDFAFAVVYAWQKQKENLLAVDPGGSVTGVGLNEWLRKFRKSKTFFYICFTGAVYFGFFGPWMRYELLRSACLTGHETVVQALVAMGTDTERVGEASPLMAAAIRGHLGIVRTLLDHGADINFHDPSGQTALSAAERAGKGDVVSFLRGYMSPVKQ